MPLPVGNNQTAQDYVNLFQAAIKPGITKAFPNADLHVFANCGHWVQWEMHEKFDRMVADFFDN